MVSTAQNKALKRHTVCSDPKRHELEAWKLLYLNSEMAHTNSVTQFDTIKMFLTSPTLNVEKV